MQIRVPQIPRQPSPPSILDVPGGDATDHDEAPMAARSAPAPGLKKAHSAIGHAKYPLTRANVVTLTTGGGHDGTRTRDLHRVMVAL